MGRLNTTEASGAADEVGMAKIVIVWCASVVVVVVHGDDAMILEMHMLVPCPVLHDYMVPIADLFVLCGANSIAVSPRVLFESPITEDSDIESL